MVLEKLSIYENITYGLEEEEFTEEDVYTAARQACAHDFIVGFAGAICVIFVSFVLCCVSLFRAVINGATENYFSL